MKISFSLHAAKYHAKNPEPLVPDKAVVVKVRDVSMMIYHHGTGLNYWIDGIGEKETAEEIGQSIKETDGVFMWSGHIGASTDYWGEHDEWLEGQARPITDDEWKLIIDGDEPWDHEELEVHRTWAARVNAIYLVEEKERQISALIEEIHQRMGLDKVQL